MPLYIYIYIYADSEEEGEEGREGMWTDAQSSGSNLTDSSDLYFDYYAAFHEWSMKR
tara:strand:+ start:170 stop:340 length:171 start_codon:yes stop_codon:yes gene_type:complete